MTRLSSENRKKGFTQADLLILLIMVGMGLLWAICCYIAYPRSEGRKSTRLKCVSNLKQIGLAFRLWSSDHGERFPMSVSPFDGGTFGFSRTDDAFYHYLATSNDMNSPKVLVCPRDKERTQATNFATFRNRNLSYFIGLDAGVRDPEMILSGDRNLSTNGGVATGVFLLTTNPPMNWTKDIHANCGNVGVADGRVHQFSNPMFLKQIGLSTNSSARVAIP